MDMLGLMILVVIVGKNRIYASDPTGFNAQFNNAISFDNEQGTTNQQLYLLDTCLVMI